MSGAYPPLPGPYRVGVVDVALSSDRDDTQARSPWLSWLLSRARRGYLSRGSSWPRSRLLSTRRAGLLPHVLPDRGAARQRARLAAALAVRVAGDVAR